MIDHIPGEQQSSVVAIEPETHSTHSLVGNLRELWKYRRMISLIAARQIRLRYKGTAFGVLWSLVTPLIQVATISLIVGNVLSPGSKNVSAYIFCAFVPWIFFSNALMDASSSVLQYAAIFKKVYFPREILPIASICANFVHFVAALIVFLVYRYVITTLLFGWPGLPPREILWLPVIVLDMIALTLGLGFIACALTTFFEDVKYIVVSGLQVLFYALPIMYFAESIFYSPSGTSKLRSAIYHLYLANPMAWIITGFKQCFFSVHVISSRYAPLVRSAPFDTRYLAITTVFSMTVLWVGYQYFNRVKWKFVERP